MVDQGDQRELVVAAAVVAEEVVVGRRYGDEDGRGDNPVADPDHKGRWWWWWWRERRRQDLEGMEPWRLDLEGDHQEPDEDPGEGEFHWREEDEIHWEDHAWRGDAERAGPGLGGKLAPGPFELGVPA